MRPSLCIFAVSALLPALAGAARADAVPAPPALDAKSYALLDYDSGELIASLNPDLHVEPASLTKVMTVYIAFDEIRQGRLHMDDEVLISEKAWRVSMDRSESRMFLDVGSRVKVSDLLRGIIVQSGNDACIALAEHIAGSETAFVDLMNQYARKLGMTDTHFADVNGMPDPQHYTSARDLVILARALIRNFPAEYKMFAERDFTWHKIHQDNRNGLLWKDPSVDGIKTGHTESAGYCLLSSAVRDGRRLIAAVMGTKSWAYRESASLELLNYGFRFYETDRVLGPDAPVATVRAYKGAQTEVGVGTLAPVFLALPAGSRAALTVQPQIAQKAIAPFSAGQPVGQATILLAGKPIKTVPLVALHDVAAGGFWRRLIDTIRLWLGW
jgi:D-alanyl-D-alanine carboxypeptidase (penicillin-binding protein 5/6)